MNRGVGLRFGLFALLSLVLTTAIALVIANVSFAPRDAFQARVDDVGGLKAGDDVRMAGVRVGVIRDIGVDQGRAVIEFTVDRDVELPEDTTARVQWVDLIGSNELLLRPGTATTSLRPGDELIATSSATDLAELADTIGPLAQTLDPDRLNELTQAVVAFLDGREQDVPRLFREFESVLSTVTEREDVLDEALANFTTVAETVSRREDQIMALVDHLLLVAGTFEASEEILRDAISDTGSFLQDLDGFFETVADDLEGGLSNLASLTGTLAAEIDTIESAVSGLPATAEAGLRATSGGDSVTLFVTCAATGPPPCLGGGVLDGVTGSLRGASEDELRRLLLGGDR